MKPKIMLIGLGGLGSVVLELLAREENPGQILVGSRNEEQGIARCNLARLSAMAQGLNPDIRFIGLDLNEKEAVSEIIHRESPDLILSTATMQTWWLPDLLPPQQAESVKNAGFGMWLPVHLNLTLKLMEALHSAHYRGLILTAPFPDVVNCVLGKLDLAPTCGVGNIDEIVPKVRLLAAEQLNTPLESVHVVLVAHHALEDYVFPETPYDSKNEIPPYFLRVEHNGKDVTEEINADELLMAPYPLTPGAETHYLTGGSTVKLIRAIFSGKDKFLHVPGPNGLPGGYPVTVNREGVKPVTIRDLTLAEAIDINERSHRFDGVERIERDGTVIFCSDSVAAFRDTLGYDCERILPDDIESRAQELMMRFREYAVRCGIEI